LSTIKVLKIVLKNILKTYNPGTMLNFFCGYGKMLPESENGF